MLEILKLVNSPEMAEMLFNYIKPELLILVVILWYVGTKIKASKKIEDWAIPFILMAISVIFALSYVLIVSGLNPMAMWVGIMQGLAIAVLEGYLYQVYKQSTRNRKQDKLT